MQNLRILAVAALFLGLTETPIHAQGSWEFLDRPEGETHFVALSPRNPVVFVEDPGKVSKMAFLAQEPVTIRLAFVHDCETGEDDLQIYFPNYKPALEFEEDGRLATYWPVAWVGRTQSPGINMTLDALHLLNKNGQVFSIKDTWAAIAYVSAHKALATGFEWLQEGYVIAGIDLEGTAEAIEKTRNRCNDND